MKSNFPDLLKRLNDHGVEYVLVGGMAANVHGSSITTMDCDIVVALALAPLSPTFRHKIPPQSFDEAMAGKGGWKNLCLDTSSGVLDCLGDIKGLGDFAECRAQSMEVDLGGFSIKVLRAPPVTSRFF